MIKRRYDAITGKLGKAYPDHYIVPEPYLTLTDEDNDKISTDTENLYYYINGVLTKKDRAEIEAKEKRVAEIKAELDALDLKTIRALRSNDTEYIQKYEEQANALRTELVALEEQEAIRLEFLTGILTFKSKVTEVLNNKNIKEVVIFIKDTIECLKDENIENEEKKQELDSLTVGFIEARLKSNNIYVQFLINVLIECVPLITQLIYDLLKDRIDGITKKEV